MGEVLKTASGRRLAFDRVAGAGPVIVFVHGFRSDRAGTKVVDLFARARAAGRAMVAADLSGHGESPGRVEDFGIGDWLDDLGTIIGALTEGPVVLVGSSLGGWLSLLFARENPARVAGLVTIAAAPDFTRRMEADFTDADRAAMAAQGFVTRPSDYAEGDYVFSRRLFEQGAAHSVFGARLVLPMPVRMLMGTADEAVPMADALRLLDHAEGPDIRLDLVKGADHRFSAPAQLEHIWRAVGEVA